MRPVEGVQIMQKAVLTEPQPVLNLEAPPVFPAFQMIPVVMVWSDVLKCFIEIGEFGRPR